MHDEITTESLCDSSIARVESERDSEREGAQGVCEACEGDGRGFDADLCPTCHGTGVRS